MTDEQKKKLANKADYMAGLQFNPMYSKDAYTACKISFMNGAQWVIDNPGGVGLTAQPEQSFSREEVVELIMDFGREASSRGVVNGFDEQSSNEWLNNKLKTH